MRYGLRSTGLDIGAAGIGGGVGYAYYDDASGALHGAQLGMMAGLGVGGLGRLGRRAFAPRAGAASRAKGYDDWFPFWHDRGGETFAWRVKDRKLIGPKYLPGTRIEDRPGTIAYLDSVAHESVHRFVIKHLPSVHDLGNLRVADVPLGASIKYLEEVVAYGVGHLRVGRVHGVPFSVFEPALSKSLTGGEKAVAISTFLAAGGWGIYEYNN